MSRAESLKTYRREGETLAQTRERLRAVVAKADADVFASTLRKTEDGRTALALAVAVFGSTSAARAWTLSPAIGLAGHSAAELMLTDDGRQRVIELLGRLEHGGYS